MERVKSYVQSLFSHRRAGRLADVLALRGRSGQMGSSAVHPAMDDTSWAQVARAALASTTELTAIPPERLAKLQVYEARDDDTPPFSLAAVVKRQAVFWQDRLTALKAAAIATWALGGACPRHWP